MQLKTYSELYNQMKQYLIINQNKVTDFNEGSVISSFIEVIAKEIASLYARTKSGFETHMRNLPMSVFDFPKLEGEKASTSVVFSRAKPRNFSTGIAKGTIVASGAFKFITTLDGSIAAGATDSVAIPVIAEASGDAYNVVANSIQTIISPLSSDIVAVINKQEARGGRQGETWADYLNRFGEYIWGLQRTNRYGFLSGLKAAGDIRSMYIEEHFPPLDDIWNITVYLEDGSGGMPDDALKKAQAKIDGDGSANNGGYRAPGILVRYKTPEIIKVKVELKAWVNYDIRRDELEKALITRIISEQAFGFINAHIIGRHLLLNDLIVELKRIQFLYDVKVLSPTEDIVVKNNQIVQCESCEIKIEETIIE